jgi:threonine aldolase
MMNDYTSAAHPSVIKAISDAANNKYEGYGVDEECEKAADIIRELVGERSAEVHFLPAGTVTNITGLGCALRPFEAILTARTGHIYQHETGALEAAGHKILDYINDQGKLLPEHIEAAVAEHVDEHMVVPKIAYISQPTELGTVYTKAELLELRDTCHAHDIYLYIDGARLGGAQGAKGNDVEITDFPKIADAFYIGGTKNGLLFGEALVLINPAFKDRFRYYMKQQGGMLAKGFLLGLQFQAIFKDGLYFKLAKHANDMAVKMGEEIIKLGYELEAAPLTNLIFVITTPEKIAKFEEEIIFERFHTFPDGRESFRLVTTWETTDEDIERVLEVLKQ